MFINMELNELYPILAESGSQRAPNCLIHSKISNAEYYRLICLTFY